MIEKIIVITFYFIISTYLIFELIKTIRRFFYSKKLKISVNKIIKEINKKQFKCLDKNGNCIDSYSEGVYDTWNTVIEYIELLNKDDE